jgi:hypothetical protein
VGLLLVSTPPIYVRESSGFEKLAEASPDEKFGVLISCVGESKGPFEEENSFEGIGRSMPTQSMLPQRSELETEISRRSYLLVQVRSGRSRHSLSLRIPLVFSENHKINHLDPARKTRIRS